GRQIKTSGGHCLAGAFLFFLRRSAIRPFLSYLRNWRDLRRSCHHSAKSGGPMKRMGTVWAIVFACILALHGQERRRPQNARQALIEMYFSKTYGTIEMHLQDEMWTAFSNAGGGTLFIIIQVFDA